MIELPMWVQATPGGGLASTGLEGVGVSVSGASSAQDDANGPHVLLTTGATANSAVRVETSAGIVSTVMEPVVSFRITTGASIADYSLQIGLFQGGPDLPDYIDTECAEIRYSTDTDGTAFWRVMTCDSAGTQQETTTSAAIATSTEYLIRIAATASSIAFYVNGTLVATHSGNIPTSSTMLRAGVYLSTLTAASKSVAFGHIRVGQVDHGQTAGLGDDDHTQYALLAGRASSQHLKGGTAASETLTLESTAHATKGGVQLGSGDWLRVPEIAAPGTPAAGFVSIYAKADGLVYGKDDAGTETKLSNAAGGAGDVVGPASSTDNAIARFDGVTGKLIQDSAATLSDLGTLVTAAMSAGTVKVSSAASLQLKDAGGNYATLSMSTATTADRTFSIATGDAARTLDISAVDVTISTAGAALIDDANAAAQRTTLGVGTGDSPEFAAVNIGHASDTTITRTGAGDIAVEGNAVYRAGGTDVALADGGTGASLADPNDDRIMFWDDSAGQTTWLTAGSGLTISGTTITANASSDNIIVFKSTDETVTSSAALQDDDHLTFSVGASQIWVFEGVLYASGATAGDIQVTFSNPSLATLRWGAIGPSASSAWDSTAPEQQAAADMEVYGGTSGTINYGLNGTSNPITILFKGSCATSINSGSVTLRWAQRVSSATATTVYAHSWLRATRVS